MFEVPDAKRIRREELYGSSSDEEQSQDDQLDSTLRERLNAQFSGLLDLNFAADGEIGAQQISEAPAENTDENSRNVEDDEGPQEEAFTFRLFRDEEPSRKVILAPQNVSAEKGGDGAFVVAKRPTSYYLAEEPSPEIEHRFRMAAVSADYLFQDAKRRRWGLEKPWKVTTITITTSKETITLNGSVNENTTIGAGKKRRPGKKRRIILRMRERAKKEREEAAKQQLIEKEEHLKDKKKRLNRQKKLKRRAKEKEKKQGGKDDEASEHSNRDSPEE
ncbi:hypothetical protein F5Y11DRAFT_317540 [Daldinia sp. FL1419]|nr:hypothetical protein F5Y11DRAFT_317540 [Daldinia sp. FL1419]